MQKKAREWSMIDNTKTGSGDIVRLQLDGDALSLFVPVEEGAAREIRVGSVAGIRDMLARGRVTGAMLEGVIAGIEDLIMPSIRGLPGGARLGVGDSELVCVLKEVADASGGDFSIEAVERLFNELADVASGLPEKLSRSPMTASFVLGLVLLREVMHHGGFKSAMVLP